MEKKKKIMPKLNLPVASHINASLICALSDLDKWFEKNLKRSPFDNGDKGLKR